MNAWVFVRAFLGRGGGGQSRMNKVPLKKSVPAVAADSTRDKQEELPIGTLHSVNRCDRKFENLWRWDCL